MRSNLSAIFVYVAISVVVINIGNGEVVNKKEKDLIAKLRLLVNNLLYEDYMKEDYYLARFLRVRDFDIERSKEMIEDVMEWRKKNQIDTILLEDFGPIEKEFPVLFDGSVDKNGRPIFIMKFGNIRKIMLSGQKDNFIRVYQAVTEAVAAGVREMNLQSEHKNITQAFLIVDMGGFNLKQHACLQCVQLAVPLTTGNENYYPGGFYRSYIVNTPGIFLPTFELARPFLSSSTKKALQLFDQNSDKWKRALLKEISPDQLPILYGGTRKNVVPTTFSQLRQKSPFVNAAYEKLLAKHNNKAV